MSYRIGSAPECDIVFNSPKVSRLHAEIAVLNSGDILLKDKNSTNGTFVNNRPIQPDQWVNIRRGDLIRFADMELQWASVPQIDNSMFKKIFGIGKNAHYNEIVANGNTVSNFHATLKIDKNGHAFIEDHSLNGTAVCGISVIWMYGIETHGILTVPDLRGREVSILVAPYVGVVERTVVLIAE